MKKPVCYICYPNTVPKSYRPTRHFETLKHTRNYLTLDIDEKDKFDRWKNRLFPTNENKKKCVKNVRTIDVLKEKNENINNEYNDSNIINEENDYMSMDNEDYFYESSGYESSIDEDIYTLRSSETTDSYNEYQPVPEKKILHAYEPFSSQTDALLYILMYGPGNNFSDAERERILHFMEKIIKLNPTKIPSLSTLKAYGNKIQTPKLVERKYSTPHGPERYFSLDLEDIFSMYCTVPGAMKDLILIPEHSNQGKDKTTIMKGNEILREEYQPLKIKSTFHTFNLFDELKINLDGINKTCLLTGVRSNKKERELRLLADNKELWIKENNIKILNTENISNIGKNSVLTKSLQFKNAKTYTFYVSIYNDATAGSTTKKWSAHEIFGLNILNTKNSQFPMFKNIIFSIIRCLGGNPVQNFAQDLVCDLQKLQKGIFLFDPNTLTWIHYRVLLVYLKGDNPAIDTLLGNKKSPLNCRLCQYKMEIGTLTYPDIVSVGTLKLKSKIISYYEELNTLLNSNSSHSGEQKTVSMWCLKYNLSSEPSPFLQLDYFNPFLQSPIEVLHTVYLGLYKYLTIYLLSTEFGRNQKYDSGEDNYFGTFLQLKNKSLEETLEARVNGFNFFKYDNRLNAYDITKRFRSFNGKDFRTFVSISLFILVGIVRRKALDVFAALSDFNTFLHKVPCTDIDTWSVQYDEYYSHLIEFINLWNPEILKNKTKIHLLKHMPYYVRKFGSFSEFSTEYFEAKNKDIRRMLYHSAHTQHSKSSMQQISKHIGLSHLVSGGWQKNYNTVTKSIYYTMASKSLLDLVKDPIIATCLEIKHDINRMESTYMYKGESSNLETSLPITNDFLRKHKISTTDEYLTTYKSVHLPSCLISCGDMVITKDKKVCEILFIIKSQNYPIFIVSWYKMKENLFFVKCPIFHKEEYENIGIVASEIDQLVNIQHMCNEYCIAGTVETTREGFKEKHESGICHVGPLYVYNNYSLKQPLLDFSI